MPGQKPRIEVSDNLASVSFRAQEYALPPGAEGVANLVFDLPEIARGVKGGARYSNEENRKTPYLFEIQCVAVIKFTMGLERLAIHLSRDIYF